MICKRDNFLAISAWQDKTQHVGSGGKLYHKLTQSLFQGNWVDSLEPVNGCTTVKSQVFVTDSFLHTGIVRTVDYTRLCATS